MFTEKECTILFTICVLCRKPLVPYISDNLKTNMMFNCVIVKKNSVRIMQEIFKSEDGCAREKSRCN